MTAFLTRSDERRSRLQAEKKELLKVTIEQKRIKDSLISRLEALKQREANQIEQELSILKTEDAKVMDQIEVIKNAQDTLEDFIH